MNNVDESKPNNWKNVGKANFYFVKINYTRKLKLISRIEKYKIYFFPVNILNLKYFFNLLKDLK